MNKGKIGLRNIDPEPMSRLKNWHIRPMRPDDISDILAIQQSAYPAELIECHEVLLAKLMLSPESCWFAEHAGQAMGYVFSHPWPDSAPPELDQSLRVLPERCSALFIHDLALHPTVRGLGLGQALAHYALAWARQHRFTKVTLIAVSGAHAFWKKHGFASRPNPSFELSKKLAAYGASADYLEMQLAYNGTAT